MSYRIFMTIGRGMTDSTAVCVFPWEQPILEEIHGGNAQLVTIDEMCSLKDVVKVKKIEPPIAKKQNREVDPGLTLRQQLELMATVDPDEDPINDLDGEFGRLVGKYGMHIKIALPNVEKVYGSASSFRRVAMKFRGSKPPKNAEIEVEREGDEPENTEKPIGEMGKGELQALLGRHKIPFDKKATIEELRDMAETVMA